MAWRERVGTDTWNLKTKVGWKDGAWLASGGDQVLRTLRGRKIDFLGVTTAGDHSLLITTENFGPEAGKITLFQPVDAGGWEAVQVDRSVQRIYCLVPSAYASLDSPQVYLFYYEVGRPRFQGDPLDLRSTLVAVDIELVVD